MPTPTAEDVPPSDVTSALARIYRRFAEDQAGTSPLYERIALALSESAEALGAVGAAPPRRRQPALILAALHDLALGGRAPALAAAYASGDASAAADAAIDTLVSRREAVADLAAHRRVRTEPLGRGAVLYPVIAEAAHRAGAQAVGLIDLGCGAGLNLAVDRLGITYTARQGPGNAGGPGRAGGTGEVRGGPRQRLGDPERRLGDPASPVQLSCTVVGERPVPARAIPPVAARIGIDRDPLDMTDADDARWLRACLPPDRAEEDAQLRAQSALVASARPLLLRGDPIGLLPEALARVPPGALPVVTTTWALSRFPVERRLAFRRLLEEAAADRPVAWASVEGVGVAPTVPTFGDRPASGHSIIGVVTGDGSGLHAEAVGRCWSRGRLMAWLAQG